MSTQIHMDVEAARSAQSAMSTTWESMGTAFTETKNKSDGIRNQGDWISPSHDEFIGLWTDWVAHMENGLTQLSDLQDCLGKEIAKWETAASELD